MENQKIVNDIDQLINLADKILDRIDETNEQLYTDIVKHMTDEELAAEFDNNIGNFCRDFEWLMARKGREAIEDQLIDRYRTIQYERRLV